MKKRWMAVIGLLCMGFTQVFCPCARVQAQEAEEVSESPGPESLYARSAVLMDADSGRILFGKEENEKRPMASTTKIMTCIVTLENMQEGQTAAASDYAAGRPKVKLGVRSGEEYYIQDLLYSLMLESHNDSAVVIAEEIGGSVEQFAGMMNAKAEEIGCKDTHFVTPNGLDGEDEGGIHGTTAADLAAIMRYCIMSSPKREEFLAITQTRSYQFTDVSGSRSFSCSNHNAFLDMMEGALTGKTGFTADAGYCYVGALKEGDRTFIVALLACGWPNNRNYKWKDTRALMEYGLANYEYRNVYKDFPDIRIPVKGGVSGENPYARNCSVRAGIADKNRELMLLLRADETVETRQKTERSFEAPVKAGEKAGTLTYYLEGEPVGSYEIVTLEQIKERKVSWCFQEILKRVCL